jgi:hyperosmotically inducible protein
LIAGAVLTLGSASWAADANSAVEDTVITTKVKAALVADPQTKARQINVDTKNGKVQLNGFVDSSAEKIAAEKAARQVQGVSSVDNNLQMRAAERSAGAVVDDSIITTRVKTALTTDSRVKASDVTVKTNQGTVALGGFVASDAEKLAAESVASSVPGVVSVHNGIVVGKR